MSHSIHIVYCLVRHRDKISESTPKKTPHCCRYQRIYRRPDRHQNICTINTLTMYNIWNVFPSWMGLHCIAAHEGRTRWVDSLYSDSEFALHDTHILSTCLVLYITTKLVSLIQAHFFPLIWCYLCCVFKYSRICQHYPEKG